MPGGEGVTPRAGDSAEIEIIMEIINEWFGDLLVDRQDDLGDCAGNITQALADYYEVQAEDAASAPVRPIAAPGNIASTSGGVLPDA